LALGLAFTQAAACPDLFAIHCGDGEDRWQLLTQLRRTFPEERWLVITPTASRAGQIAQRLCPDHLGLLLVSESEDLNGSAASWQAVGLLTLKQLRKQFEQQIRTHLHNRLEQLAQLQNLHLEIMHCDLLLNECTTALQSSPVHVNGTSKLLILDCSASQISASQISQWASLQQRVAECEARYAELKQQLQLLLTDQATPSSEPPPGAHASPGRFRQWIQRLAAAIVGRRPSSTPTPSTSCNGGTHFCPARDQQLEEQLHIVEKELTAARAAWDTAQQQWQQALQQRIQSLRAQRERLHTQREQLIGTLGEAAGDGQSLEQELARLRRQSLEIDALLQTRLAQHLHHCTVMVAIATDAQQLHRQLNSLTDFIPQIQGIWQRIIYDNCEQLPPSVFIPTLPLAPRQLLLGELLPSTDSEDGPFNDSAAAPCTLSSPHSWFPAFVRRLDQRRWCVRGEHLILRLQELPPQQQGHWREEPLLDCPQVILRFHDLSDDQTELAEIIFPSSWGLAARCLALHHLLPCELAPLGPAQWSSHEHRRLRICWPWVEAQVHRYQSDWIDWDQGVQEWCVWDGQNFFTAAVSFDPAYGWDQASAQTWITERLPQQTHQRFAVIPAPAAHANAVYTPGLASSSSPAASAVSKVDTQA
jgi:hypothetical protein